MTEPLTREDLDYYHHLLELGFASNGLANCADAIRAMLNRFDRTRLPTAPANTGAVPWQRTGAPRGKQRMDIGVTQATGTARKSLEYGIERHKAALGLE